VPRIAGCHLRPILGYTYDGALLTGTTWTGPVAGSVTRTYDTDFRVSTESLSGGNTITLEYDPDSLLTGAGALTLTRDPQHGFLTQITEAINGVTGVTVCAYDQAGHLRRDEGPGI
jgi:YD repeat-containing protein